MNDLLPHGGHYRRARRSGNLVFTAGQVPRDSDRNVVGENIEDQTVVVMDNLKAALASVGANLADVVKVTVHLQDLKDVLRFNQVYADYFSENPPVRTVVGSNLNGVLIEIDVVAHVIDDGCTS